MGQITLGTDATMANIREAFVGVSLEEDFILANPALITKNNQIRGIGENVTVESLCEDVKLKRRLITKTDVMRQEMNLVAAKGKESSVEERAKVKEYKPLLKELDEQLAQVKVRVQEQLSWLPNLTSPEVPLGPPENNLVLRKVGEPKQFSFTPKPHTELGKELNILDMERGSQVAGKGFYYLKNELVLLRQALSMMVMTHLARQGFEPIITPLVAKERTLVGTGYFPFATGDSFQVSAIRGACLIGTSEQTLIAQHMDEILDLSKGAKKYVCDSACFRTEAGSHGRMAQGMLRVHQFGKVEQIIFCSPEESDAAQLQALANEEWLLKELKIPYQVVLIAAQDMGAPGYKKYDIEGWMPSLGTYMELTSNTNLTDFQTRRLNIRFKQEQGRTQFPHTISATAFSDRLLVAIMENYQQSDGSIAIPDVLKGALGGLIEIKRKQT